MCNVFLSYSHRNSDEVSTFAAQLRARGIRIWRDVDDLPAGRLTENEIRRAISAECWGLTVYLTPESMTADFVMSVELPAAINRQQIDPGFPIVPVFRSMTPDEARAGSMAELGVDLTAYNGHIIGSDVGDTADLQHHLRLSANKVLRAYLSRAFDPMQPEHDRKPRLDLHTWPSRRNDPPPDLDLDWSRFFSNESLPSYDVWQSLLLPALSDVKDALAEITGPRTLCARAKARLSAALALGFIFRQPSGFNIEIEQDGETWSTAASRSQASALRVTEADGDIRCAALAVQMCISSDVSPAVNRYVQARGRDFRARLRFEPQGGPGRSSVPDGQYAIDMAAQAGKRIRQACNDYRAEEIHLFASMPLGLAVLLGHQLNACGAIQCYEFENLSSSYHPSCLLGGQP
jgi:hypothetical protein